MLDKRLSWVQIPWFPSSALNGGATREAYFLRWRSWAVVGPLAVGRSAAPGAGRTWGQIHDFGVAHSAVGWLVGARRKLWWPAIASVGGIHGVLDLFVAPTGCPVGGEVVLGRAGRDEPWPD